MGPTKSMMTIVVAMAAVLGTTKTVFAEEAPPRNFVLFFLAAGETDPDSTSAFQNELVRLGENTPRTRLLGQGEVRSKLRMAGVEGLAQAAVIRCGSDVACIADLGSKAGGSEVLLVHIVGVADKPVIVVKILAIGTANQEILRRTKLQIDTVDKIRSTLWENREAVLGSAALEAVPVTDPEPDASDSQATLATQVESPPPEVSQTWWRDRSLLRYVGAGVAGAGGVLFVTGIGFGVHADSVSGSIDRDTNQPRAVELEQDANRAAERANGLFAGGAVLLVAGAGILLWELFGIDWFDGAAVGVSADEAGATATVGMSW